MSKPRRVLVLAGGGAKGAYAFGCLKAFKEAGIEFKAVAGTSVGAINAVLWSSGAFAEGERLWRNLSFSSVYPVRFLDPAAHSRAVIRVLAISFVVIRLIWATFHKWPVPGARTWCAVMAAISASPMLILLLSAPFEPMRATMIVIAYLVFVWLGSSALKRRGDNGQLAFCIGAINILWMSTLFAISDYREIRTFPPWAALSLFLILILSAAGSYYLLYCVFQAFARNDAAILGAAPLRDQIAAIVRDHPLSMSTVVGIAKETAVFDPDDPKWATMDLTGDHGQPSADATWYPDLQRVWCPVYLQIEGKPADVAATWCAASAALPFGIVPSVITASGTYVDGGLVDNCPIVPFVYGTGFDELFIVLLEPFSSDADAIERSSLAPDACSRRRRLLRLVEFPSPEACLSDKRPFREKNDPPSIVPLEKATSSPKLVLFYPSARLGGFLSGTLNFDGKYASALIDRGQRDAVQKLAAIQQNASPA